MLILGKAYIRYYLCLLGGMSLRCGDCFGARGVVGMVEGMVEWASDFCLAGMRECVRVRVEAMGFLARIVPSLRREIRRVNK